MLRAAIIGLGRWGRALVNSVHGKSDSIHFVAAQTRTPAAAAAFCAERGIALIESYERILADPAVDAVVLATPHSSHEAQIVAAAAAGKHVFVEKPIALDRMSAARAVAAARRANVQLAVGFGRRFHPSVAEARARLADGRLGRLVAMVGQHTAATNRFVPAGNWRIDPAEAPGGALTAVGVHLMDQMIEFAGPARSVHCVSARHERAPADDTTTLLLTFAGGVTGTIFCSVATASNFNLTVYGDNGLAEISGTALERFRFCPMPDAAPTGVVMAPPSDVIEHAGFDMLKAELDAFAGAVRGERAFPVPIEDVLAGMAAFDAAVESARTGAVVAVA